MAGGERWPQAAASHLLRGFFRGVLTAKRKYCRFAGKLHGTLVLWFLDEKYSEYIEKTQKNCILLSARKMRHVRGEACFDRTAAPAWDVAMQKSCATLKDMQTQRAYFFYFWFSPTAAER
ncbi:hypothetical protein [Comamonas sp.]|uniref:hypothetical protein n=1 Tax=Comamonas sp. TaxID=34028 RepID=UPI0012D29F06|nr:hypothetical protein [Comamonas sp.]MPS92279.1 hypothetical protein [Comamonas sp.]